MKPGPHGAAEHADRPNVVLLTAHDMGRYLSCYGRQARTPNLDQLAEGGALFEEAFCVTPTCAPSRACVQTGLLTHNNGMFGHPGEGYPGSPDRSHYKGWTIDEGIRTLPMYLNDRGYETHLVGTTHATMPPERLGCETIHRHPDPGPRSKSTHEVWQAADIYGASDAADLVDQIVTSAGSDPFYVQVETLNAHGSQWSRDGVFDDRSDYDGPAPEEIDLPDHVPDDDADVEGYDAETMRQEMAAMLRSVNEIDRAVGRMIETLEAEGIRDETLFVFTVDHGIPQVPKGKTHPYDPGIEIATLFNYPETVESCRPDDLVSNVDLLPTILDLVDGQPPVDIDGVSHRPLIDPSDDRDYTPREHVFIEQTWLWRGDGYDPIRGIRTENHKFIRNFWPVSYDDDTPRDRLTETELYDLDADPHETENVTDDPAYRNVREDLYSRLRDKLERDHAPILDGPIPPVPGVFDIEI